MTTINDRVTPVEKLKEAVRKFAVEREWEQFHSPKNLSMGLAVEAAELMEHFLWIDNEASRQIAGDVDKKRQVGEEMADVACYLLTLSYTLDIDLSSTILAKIAKNALKYPVEQVRGKFGLKES